MNEQSKSPYLGFSLFKAIGMGILATLFLGVIFSTLVFHLEQGPWFALFFSFDIAATSVLTASLLVVYIQLKEADSVLKLVLNQEVAQKHLKDAAVAAAKAIDVQRVSLLRSTDDLISFIAVDDAKSQVKKANKQFRVLRRVFKQYGFTVESLISAYTNGCS